MRKKHFRLRFDSKRSSNYKDNNTDIYNMYRSSSDYGEDTKESSSAISGEEHDEVDDSKEEQFLDDEGSSEFVDNPISSPVVRTKKMIINTTPLKTPSIRSPSSSVKRRSMYEAREKRNSRLFSSNQMDNTRLFNDTLNLENNDVDILDFDHSILPRIDYSPKSWKYQHTSNNSNEIESLKKKVTGYQLQIRLIMDFLQKNGTNDLLNKLESEDFDLVRCNKCDEKDEEKRKLDVELVACKNKYESIEKKLQMYQEQLNITNDQLSALLNVIDESEKLVDGILAVLGGQVDGELKDEIIQIKGMEVDAKLAVVLKILSTTSVPQINADSDPDGTYQYIGQDLKQLQHNFRNSEEQLQEIKTQLNTSVEDSKILIESYRLLKNLLSSQVDTVNELKSANQAKDEKIKILTEMIDNSKSLHNDSEINGLTSKIGQMGFSSSGKTKNIDKDVARKIEALEDDKFTLSNEVITAKSRIKELTDQIEKSNAEFDKRLENLLRQSQVFQDELRQKEDELRSMKRELDHQKLNESKDKNNIINLTHELSVAAEKERSLTTEKFALKHQVDSILKDKKTLQINIEILKEKLANYSNDKNINNNNSNSNSQDGFWNARYEELLVSDTKIVTKFLKIFEEILDSQSIEQAKLKILELSNRSSLARDQKRIKELHESIFHYYVSGIQAIIQDYLSLIKQLELVEKDKNFKILNLTHEINRLKRQSSNINDQPNDENKDDNILRLRIEDLTRKWKLERESRKAEGDNAKKRLAELERENFQLKQKLKNVS